MKSGWQTQKVGDLCHLISGQHIDSKDYNTEARGIGYLTGPSDFGPLNPVVSKWTEFPKVTAKSGDILITVKGSGVGKVNLLNQDEVAISRQLMAVRVANADPRFIYAFLDSAFDHFQSLSTGAAIPGISREQVLGLEIGLPPLPEQSRIVAVLDEAFDGIATAKANAEKNLKNARTLFESYVQDIFTKCTSEWDEKKLGDLCELFQGLCINSKTKHLLVNGGGIPLLRIKDLREGRSEQFVMEKGWPENAYVSEQDIVYTRTGQIGLVFRGRSGVLHNNCFKVKPKPALNNDYLFWWLQNPLFKAHITSLALKAAQPDITHALFKAQHILLPPNSYQERMVPLIEEMNEETQRLESLYRQKIAALDDLKKSLLHQAFTGQL